MQHVLQSVRVFFIKIFTSVRLSYALTYDSPEESASTGSHSDTMSVWLIDKYQYSDLWDIYEDATSVFIDVSDMDFDKKKRSFRSVLLNLVAVSMTCSRSRSVLLSFLDDWNN